MVMFSVDPAVPFKLFDNEATAAPFNGTAVAIPRAVIALTWLIRFASAPSAVSIKLQVSNDNTNWFDLDTSSATAGEARTYSNPVNYQFIRARRESQTGGGNVTVEVTIS